MKGPWRGCVAEEGIRLLSQEKKKKKGRRLGAMGAALRRGQDLRRSLPLGKGKPNRTQRCAERKGKGECCRFLICRGEDEADRS